MLGEQYLAPTQPRPLHWLNPALWDHSKIIAWITRKSGVLSLCLAGKSWGKSPHSKQRVKWKEECFYKLFDHEYMYYVCVCVKPEFNKRTDEFKVIGTLNFTMVREFRWSVLLLKKFFKKICLMACTCIKKVGKATLHLLWVCTLA